MATPLATSTTAVSSANTTARYIFPTHPTAGSCIRCLRTEAIWQSSVMTRYPTSMRTNIISTMCATIREQRAPLSPFSAPCLYASLYGNYIYYIRYDESEGSTLYKVKIDGSGCKQVDTAPDFTCSANGEYMYYNGTDSDHYIWRLNTTDDSKGMLYGGNCYMPTVIDDTTAYFMDCDSNYAIARTDLVTGEKTLLSEDRVDWYNLYGDYIYFQKNDSEHPCLGFMRTDGSGYTTLFEGNFKDITITSEYVYFRDFSTDQSYCVPLGSSASPVAFEPGVVED